MDKKKHDEALSGKPIARKLIAKLQRGAVGGLTGFHPAHAAYVYTQNQVSVMSEHLTH